MRVVLAFAMAALAVSVEADACSPPDGWTPMAPVNQSGFAASVLLPAEGAPISHPFTMKLWLCGLSEIGVPLVSATMPAHRHGMNYRPVIVRETDYVFVVSGMVFHMPGTWRIAAEVKAAQGNPRFTLDLEVQ